MANFRGFQKFGVRISGLARCSISQRLSVVVSLFFILFLSATCGVFRIGTFLSERPDNAVYGSTVTQYGISWSFADTELIGQFVNGDYWVIGPVDIVSIDPAPTNVSGRIMNGSMLNPTVGHYQGYDNRMFGTDFNAQYDQDLNAAMPGGQPLSAANPLRIENPASLISGISTFELGSGISNQVRTMAVLTVLDKAPPFGSFRPPYVGADKQTRFQASQLDYSLLPNLAVPANAPPIAEVAGRFERPWIEHMMGWIKECFLPRDNMHNYGRELASDVSDAALSLLLNYSREEKEALVIRMVQLGIDYHAIVNEGEGKRNWEADGGHMSGRVFPILFAGLMLNDETLKSTMSKSGRYAYSAAFYEGKLPPDYIHFGEMDQTFYVTQRDVDRTNGTNPDLYGPWSPDGRISGPQPFVASDIGLAEWGVEHAWQPSGDCKNWELPYRQVAGMSWSGYALASRVLGISGLWNHPAFFDYMDRYMNYLNGQPDRTHNEFQADMWDTFRSAY